MLCAISGEAPQTPVASLKSGSIFEKRLIESYIADHGTDPVTGEDLTPSDLIELKNARAVRPRPPTLTSIPALLSTFQDEWDALALETYTLKQSLAQTRQELSTALYDYEGALRVIAKISRERDEAREALGKISVKGGAGGGGGSNGDDAMQVDSESLPEGIVAKIEETQQKLSTTRRKRPVPKDWATAETIQSFETTEYPEAALPGSRALAVDESGDLALFGGIDGIAIVYSTSEKKTVYTLKCGGPVTSALWWDNKPVVALATGAIKIFEDGSEIGGFSVHAGAATGLSLHPSGDILASVGSDKSYVLYDLTSMSQVTRVFTNSELTCGTFHPDGHLFAAGGRDGQIKLYTLTTSSNSANFDTPSSVISLSFSENGTWLASASEGSTDVTIWDLRKMNVIKTVEVGSAVGGVRWDWTGQFLAVAAKGGVAVVGYNKGSKSWRELVRKAVRGSEVAWGNKGSSLVLLDGEGGLVTLG
ncbi:cell cycle control protein [Tothia fuscella]|uniref:Pre-mRNA-processing factor 19 n=1 Tax=Tothia fuscella TaxID=1048955 RepID=A0A9P4NHW9_9PEZI|nr:cell cycle control protein [Tothia fuscella]